MSETIGDVSVEVKIRYRHRGIPARFHLHSDGRAEVRFDSVGPAVTPGQACVFYDGARVLGGGWIARGESPAVAVSHNRRREKVLDAIGPGV